MNEQNGNHTNPRIDTRHDDIQHERTTSGHAVASDAPELHEPIRQESERHGNHETNLENLGETSEDWSDIFRRRSTGLADRFPPNAQGDDDDSDDDDDEPIEPEAVMHRLGTPGNLMAPPPQSRDRDQWRQYFNRRSPSAPRAPSEEPPPLIVDATICQACLDPLGEEVGHH